MANEIIDFIVVVLKTTIYIGLFGGLATFLFVLFYRLWTNRLKYFIKYKIMKNPYDEQYLSYCVDALEINMEIYEFKMSLLKSGIHNPREIIWIYNELKNQYGKKVKPSVQKM